MILSARQLQLLVNSLTYAGGAAVLSLVLGLVSGFILAKFHLRGKKLWLALLLVPLLIPPYLHAIAWRFLFVNLGLSTADYLYNLPAAITITTLAYFPLVTGATYFALQNLDPQLEEAASFFTNRLAIWRKITLPLILPAVLVSTLVVFLLALTNFGVTSFLHINVYVYEIFSQFSAFFDFPQAYLLTGPLLLAALITVGVMIFFTRRPYFFTQVWVRDSRPRGCYTRLGLSRFHKAILGALLLALIGLSVVVPLGVFVSQIGNLANFWFAISSSWSSILNSLWLAAFAAVLAVFFSLWLPLIGPLIGHRMPARHSFSDGGSDKVELTALIWLAIPSVTIGVLLIKLFNRPLLDVIYTSFLIVVTGYLARFLPFTYAIVNYFKRRVDLSLIEAARLTGASDSQIFRRIQLPLWLPGVIAGGLFFFLLALTELGTTMLVHPSGYQTLPIRIFILMHYGAPELVSALSLTLILLTLLIVGGGYASYHYTRLKQIV